MITLSFRQGYKTIRYKDDVTMQGDTRNVGDIITGIINGISFPLTVLLNVLVIMAVKKRGPRLQTNTNILLACLGLFSDN